MPGEDLSVPSGPNGSALISSPRGSVVPRSRWDVRSHRCRLPADPATASVRPSWEKASVVTAPVAVRRRVGRGAVQHAEARPRGAAPEADPAQDEAHAQPGAVGAEGRAADPPDVRARTADVCRLAHPPGGPRREQLMAEVQLDSC
ncbi:hypothetical protein [Streptomyces canus]|uniref:hypothetical protein n=1 Tax=Streptomyces canus TaxID=58343 RepID=UPI002786CC94|nr:hypothetical protein [Streptomyces canus]MDQ1073415.1 hypothetical protein [Streptomyces canus]